MSAQKYMRWDDPKVEPPVPNEEQTISRVSELVNGMQRQNFQHHRHAFRGTHVKTQGILKGSLAVLPNLPPHLAQGLFANGAHDHPVAIRYANEPSFLQDDRAPGPRGMSMKVFNVDGEFLDPVGERTKAQDFTFNNAPLLELTDLSTTAEIFDIRHRNFDNGQGLKKELEQRPDKDLQFAPAGLPNQHFLSYTMYSQSAFRYGDYVCKYALFPTGKFQQELEHLKITENSDPEQHSLWLQQYFAKHDAEYNFRIQLLQDINKQSVEDTSKPWGEQEFPFETIAKVTIPVGQDAFSAERRVFWDEKMKLNVWYGLKAHQPLGSVNRLRKAVYQASSSERQRMNATKVEEVSSVDQIP